MGEGTEAGRNPPTNCGGIQTAAGVRQHHGRLAPPGDCQSERDQSAMDPLAWEFRPPAPHLVPARAQNVVVAGEERRRIVPAPAAAKFQKSAPVRPSEGGSRTSAEPTLACLGKTSPPTCQHRKLSNQMPALRGQLAAGPSAHGENRRPSTKMTVKFQESFVPSRRCSFRPLSKPRQRSRPHGRNQPPMTRALRPVSLD